MDQNKSPALAATSGPGIGNTTKRHFIRPESKEARVLRAFLAGGTFNRFEAERELHDHCLHSTVSSIQAKGVIIHRRDEVVRGYQGHPTHVCRYWLAPESRQKAADLLGISSRLERLAIASERL